MNGSLVLPVVRVVVLVPVILRWLLNDNHLLASSTYNIRLRCLCLSSSNDGANTKENNHTTHHNWSDSSEWEITCGLVVMIAISLEISGGGWIRAIAMIIAAALLTI